MLPRLFARQVAVSARQAHALPFTRAFHSTRPPIIRSPWRPRRIAGAGALGGALLLGFAATTFHADDPRADDKEYKQPRALSALIRSYVVYSMCSIPILVDWSPSILSFLSSIPGVKQITEAVVRRTFFAQFVGGDTALQCIPLLEQMRKEGKGALFAYSIEVDEHEASGSGHKQTEPVHKRIVTEMIHSIDVAADFEEHYAPGGNGNGKRTWVALKLTAMLPNAQSLVNLSEHLIKTRSRPSTEIAFPGCPQSTDLDCLSSGEISPGSPLTGQDIADLKELHADLVKICSRGQERGIRIIIDSEHSWYTPAIDAISLSVMRQFNRLPARTSQSQPTLPIVYTTVQAYLRRTPEYLAQLIKDAQAGDYALGIKLVRGAYHVQETAAHNAHITGSAHSLSISPDALAPVWASKADTDACYNAAVRVLIDAVRADVAARRPVPAIGLLFGSHNWNSCNLILESLVERGLAVREKDRGREVIRVGDEVAERLTLAQLYGMSDELTDYLVGKTRSSSPFVIKYIPYGALSEVMPYLGRRAIENKSMLGEGQAAAERKRAWLEIRKRLLG